MPFRRISALFVGSLLASGVSADPTCNDLCVHIKQVIAVLGATMEGCDKAFPKERGAYTKAFKNWRLLSYRIPGLADVLAGKTSEMAAGRAAVAEDFKSPVDDRAIECRGYGAKFTAQDLIFPAEWLEPYKPAAQ